MAHRVDITRQIDQLASEGMQIILDSFSKNDDDEMVIRINEAEFGRAYSRWYSTAYPVVSQILPERLSEFASLYRDEKRRELSLETYGIFDFIHRVKPMFTNVNWAERTIGLLWQQVDLVASASARVDSVLSNIAGTLQAEFFDSEVDAAKELASKGHLRAAGTLAGVVLERHLRAAANAHGVRTRKKKPVINDWNQLLKEAGVLTVPEWRRVQLLGDLRNLCAHDTDREPNNEDLLELIRGVEVILKTVS